MEKGRRKKIVYATILICWIVFISCAFFFSSNFQAFKINPGIFDFNQPAGNHIDAFSCIRFTEPNSQRPAYAIAFDSLDLENSSIGPFTTAMYNKATIDNLQLKLYEYSPAPEKNKTFSENKTSEKLIEETKEIITRPADELNIGNINFSNVAEACANNLECKFYFDNDLTLSISCKRAAVSKSGNIDLRGHVIIKTSDGSILESNFAQWDIKQNNFKIRNSYILKQNGSVKTDKNTTFNSKLQEEYQCTAKL
ncbi:MAG: hypothetical protein A2Y10_02665 [Planctomycetes bacterium GWF2_41_51]|nr:MAG: hypothetical protein A2Y10_02665 [Planctomycetes bacterium GWF2_41_51]HBG27452.1 hypothetical protein [Phycisphaerales bacterium]